MKTKHKTSTCTVLFALLLLTAPAAMRGQFIYTTNADGVSLTITGYAGSGGAVDIPTNINGLTVTNIGSGAFAEIKSLTGVTIPGSVTNIGASAFYLCTNLRTATIPGSVTSIGVGAFAGCSLSSVTIPGSVTNIGEQAFDACQNMTSVTMLNGVASIGYEAFNMCGSLTNVTIPASVTNIQEGAFYVCTSLISATVPGSVGDSGGFGSGDELLLVFGDDLTNATVANGVTSISNYLFYGTVVRSVLLPASLTNIGPYAFDECESLTTLTIPASVTTIGAYAFRECESLTTLTIPASVTTIGTNAFQDCFDLTSVFFAGNAPPYSTLLFYGESATVYYLAGTTGWSNTYAGLPTVLWNPQIQVSVAGFGVQSNQFGFTITGTPNIPIVVQACTNLANPAWVALQSVTLTNGSYYFSQPLQSNSAGRYFRISAP